MFRHEFCLGGNIGRREVGNFECLGFNPPERFEIFQEEVFTGEAGWKLNVIVATTLRDPYDGLDLLDLFIVRRRNTVQEGSDLGAQICGCNKGAQDVFGKDVGKGAGIVFDIIVGKPEGFGHS